MAKHKPHATEKPSDGGKVAQDAALESVGIVLPETPRVYQVEIPNCLLGRKFVQATSESEAVAKYKAPCGITSHALPPIVSVMPFGPTELPPGVELFGE
jgi:hypothetical protein